METLDPKFKTLAEICLDTEIDPFPSQQSCIPISTDFSTLLGPNYFVSLQEWLSQRLSSKEEVAIPNSRDHQQGYCSGRETYTTADPCVQPTTIVFLILHAPNVGNAWAMIMAPVYEVQGTSASLLGVTHNVIYAERVVSSPGRPDVASSSVIVVGGPVSERWLRSTVGPEIQVTQMVSPDITHKPN